MKMPQRNLQAVPVRATSPAARAERFSSVRAEGESGWSEPPVRGTGYAPRGQQRDGVRPAPLTPTVYIVDDDTEFLETQNGSRAGCLVVDLRMPGLSGIDLQDELVARNAQLPVIMISGYGDVTTAARAMRAGAIDFLEKPIS